jgi:hypothetical protein
VYLQLGDPDNAGIALDAAERACADSVDAIKAIACARLKLKAVEKKYEKSQKHRYRNMFAQSEAEVAPVEPVAPSTEA